MKVFVALECCLFFTQFLFWWIRKKVTFQQSIDGVNIKNKTKDFQNCIKLVLYHKKNLLHNLRFYHWTFWQFLLCSYIKEASWFASSLILNDNWVEKKEKERKNMSTSTVNYGYCPPILQSMELKQAPFLNRNRKSIGEFMNSILLVIYAAFRMKCYWVDTILKYNIC